MVFESITATLIALLAGYWNTFILFLPRLLGAFILMSVGALFGHLVKSFLKNIMIRYKVEERLFLEKPTFKFTSLLSTIAAWSIYIVFIKAGIDVLGIAPITTVSNEIIGVLPELVKASLVVIIGYSVASFTKHHMDHSRLTYSKVMANVVFFLIIYISFVMALPLVGVETQLLQNLLLVVSGSIGLGIALALGLGLKDAVAQEAKKYKKKR
ncbi:MAG: hypothetical protein HYT70_02070 [Candidatus Aenigmarchaeota archaeon]|nr:hypothetical protein [Candidatus Aenigmarchaeota archaeon]